MPTPAKPQKRPRTDHQHRIMLIKMGQAQLMWDDAQYRAQLYALTGKSSCTEMHAAEHAKVIEHLQASGAQLKWDKRRQQKITAERAPLIAKIRILLMHLGCAPDSYADGIAKRMYRVDRYEWLDPKQLIGIITALSKRVQALRDKANAATAATPVLSPLPRGEG
jgi:phage gp16-like protein